jgi:hypothetical protein
MDAMVSPLNAASAIIVPINQLIYNAATILNNFDVQNLEYREALTSYFQSSIIGGAHPNSFEELYSSGKFPVVLGQYSFIRTSPVSSTSNSSYFVKQRGIQNLVTALVKVNNLDVVIYPEQKNLIVKVGALSQSGQNGILGGVTGFPVVVVPAGFSPTSEVQNTASLPTDHNHRLV